eukprot:26415_1
MLQKHQFHIITKQVASVFKQLSRRSFCSYRNDIRNVAIVAHVDHGKTTLVDQLLKQSGELSHIDKDRVMDSHSIERERGITILSKQTSLMYNDIRINIIDTPGHQDFGGEVERIMNMIDGLLLLIDINEGPMPQTRYILDKALKKQLIPLLIFNKLDRIFDPMRIDDSLMEIMELLDNIGYNEQQIDKIMSYIIYTSAKHGWTTLNPQNIPNEADMSLLFDAIINKISPPIIDSNTKSFKMLTSLIDSDDFWGRYLIGRVHSGCVRIGDEIQSINPKMFDAKNGMINGTKNGSSNNNKNKINVSRLFTKRGTKRVEVKQVSAGDIIGIPCENATVFDTLCSLDVTEALPFEDIDKPTISIRILINSSPLRGNVGDKVLMSDIGKRLENEAKINVCITVEKLNDCDVYIISGRGELQLAVLLENMRREGYEFSIAAPKVIYSHNEKTNEKLEPYEHVIVDVHPNQRESVINYLDNHGGSLQTFDDISKDTTRITYICPTRGLLGYESKLKSDTRGTGRLSRRFKSYESINNNIIDETIYPLIAIESGKATQYALLNLEPRCKSLYITPGDDIYEGMIVGETNKNYDMECNPCKQKHLTNIRSVNKEETVQLKSVRTLHLDDVLTRIQSDELLEITPKAIRLRKLYLSSSERKQLKRKGMKW